MRSHNASVRGFCTNGRLGRAGMVVSILVVALTVASIVRFVVDVGQLVTSA